MTRHKGLKISSLQVPVYGRIDEKTAKDLEKYTNDNHVPKSYVLNEALTFYLGPRLSKTHTHKPDYINGIGLTPGIREIIETIRNRGFDNEITQADIEEAIRTVRGHDPRTLKGWKKSLEEVGFIRETVRQSWKVAVYKLDWSMLDQSLWPDSIKNRPTPQGGIESES